jgi:rhamnogalacturonyl hydrolase YesR
LIELSGLFHRLLPPRRGVLVAVPLAVLAGTASVAPVRPAAAQADAPPVVGTVLVPRHTSIVAAMKRAADYYRPTYSLATGVRNGWSWGTYFQGAFSAFRTAGDQKYFTDVMAWGQSNQWSIPTTEGNPDSIKAGQTYYDAHRFDAGASLSTMDARMSTDLTGLPVSSYWWADALFMGLPNWTRWATRTGNSGYLDKMDALYAWTRDSAAARCTGAAPGGLYDPAERLWYRDCQFIDRRDASGRKVFWGRGNGWVLAAMAQVLATLPAGDARAAQYQDMLRAMAERLRGLQGADGFWRSSLQDPGLYPQPETSSTALFTYAIGYGINAGLLDRATYVPVVARAWDGLITTALRSTGFVSNCQPVGAQPAAPYTGSGPRTASTATSAGTLHTDSPPFCVGAFLLAGSEMAKLAGAMSTGRPVSATAQQAGNEAARAVDGELTTRWSAPGFPQSITVDLGDLYRASNATVVPYIDRAYRYRIETSTDGVHWSLAVDRTSNTTGGSKLDNFSGTVNLRYARLTVTGVYADPTGWVSIQEFAIHDRYDPRLNLARGRPTTATSSQAPYPPSNASDNESATFWVADALPTGVAAQSLTVDLQTAVAVDTVRVFSRPPYGPKDVAVLASVDGVTWSTLATATLPNAEGPHMMLVPAAQARWLRLQTTSAYSPSNVQVREFEVYAAR